MGFSIFSNNGRKAYGLKDFIVDAPKDIKKLSTNYLPGCMAFAISDSTYYMLNHQHEWKKININNSSSSSIDSDSTLDPESDYIWNAGDMDDEP